MEHSEILERFIVFEGIDGSGTTTQLRRVMQACEESRIKAFATREPTLSPIGQVLDSFLKHKISLSSQTVARLFAADRCEHIYGRDGIIEMLKQGLVFCDRYLFSSLAYQGATNEYMLTLRENATFPLPQVLFFFDIDVEVAMKRIEIRSKDKEFYERNDILRQVQKNYINIMEEYRKTYPKMHIIRIDASLAEDVVFAKIKSSLKDIAVFNL